MIDDPPSEDPPKAVFTHAILKLRVSWPIDRASGDTDTGADEGRLGTCFGLASLASIAAQVAHTVDVDLGSIR